MNNLKFGDYEYITSFYELNLQIQSDSSFTRFVKYRKPLKPLLYQKSILLLSLYDRIEGHYVKTHV